MMTKAVTPWKWKAWIFDLDDTLLDTTGTLIPQVSQRVCEFLVTHQVVMDIAAATKAWSALSHHYSGTEIIKIMIESKRDHHHGAKDILLQQAYQLFRTPVLPQQLSLLPQAEEVLLEASQWMPLFLVTQGDIATQIKKVENLKITSYFRYIYYVDPFAGESKYEAMQELLGQFSFSPEQVLSIGNRLDNEIAMSKKLGMDTCYLPYGEHQRVRPQTPEEVPDYTIDGMADLLEWLHQGRKKRSFCRGGS